MSNIENYKIRIDLLDSVLKDIKYYENIIFANEISFLKMFCFKGTDLVKISLCSEKFHFVYVHNCGQHISSSISIKEFKAWLDGLNIKEM